MRNWFTSLAIYEPSLNGASCHYSAELEWCFLSLLSRSVGVVDVDGDVLRERDMAFALLKLALYSLKAVFILS